MDIPNAWNPGEKKLVLKVLAENRRYQKIRNPRLLKQLKLTKTKNGWKCDEELTRKTGGMTYPEMVQLAEQANFRHALWQMGEAVANLFAQVVERQPAIAELPKTNGRYRRSGGGRLQR